MRRGPNHLDWRWSVSLCLAVEEDPGQRADAVPYWARRVKPVSLRHVTHGRLGTGAAWERRHRALLHRTI